MVSLLTMLFVLVFTIMYHCVDGCVFILQLLFYQSEVRYHGWDGMASYFHFALVAAFPLILVHIAVLRCLSVLFIA